MNLKLAKNIGNRPQNVQNDDKFLNSEVSGKYGSLRNINTLKNDDKFSKFPGCLLWDKTSFETKGIQ